MLAARHLRDLTLRAPPRPGRPLHLSAASGLVRVGRHLYVVADDEPQLGRFPRSGDAAGELLPLFAGELPAEHGRRKQHKRDLEALTLLPPFAGCRHGALLALGSGSRPNRCSGALLALNETGDIAAPIRPLQLERLYDRLQTQLGPLNLEGAFITSDELLLLQRGNRTNRQSAIIRLALDAFLRGLQRGHADAAALRGVVSVDIGQLEDVPLAFTDGAALPDGRFVFSAVAEDTGDSYNDGACLGTVIGVAALDGTITSLEPLEGAWKVEGISVEPTDGALDLLLVTDADDESIPAALLSARMILAKPCPGG